MKTYNLLYILLVVILSSCDLLKVKEDSVPEQGDLRLRIARVNDNYLYASEIAGIVSVNASAEDSANLMSAYMNNWIRKQLLIDEASAKIDFDEDEIQRKILDYRLYL